MTLLLVKRAALVLLFPLLTSAVAADLDLTKPITDLKPTLQQAIASINAVQLLVKNHYRKLTFDNDLSGKLLKRYLDKLDPNRSFFRQDDINGFMPYGQQLSNALTSGDLKPAFHLFNVYRKRAEERARFMLNQLDAGLAALRFNQHDTLRINRKEAPWLANQQAQQALWLKQLKDNVLSLRLNNKTDQEVMDQLRRRNTNLLRRLHQSKSEDAFQTYINAFAGIYDPHTQYFSPQTAENFDINMSLSLEGIGAVLQSEDEHTKVVSVVAGGPAERAGQLKPGDKIVGVGQRKSGTLEDVVGMRLDDVVKLIRGKKDTLVRLEVIPSTSKDGSTRVYEIVRDKVKLEEQDASSKIIEVTAHNQKQRIGVIELPAFYIDFKAAQSRTSDYKSTTRDVKRLLTKLQQENIAGLVMDLRGNGGGSLQEANELTSLFIHHGPTVIVRDNRGRTEQQHDAESSQFYQGPMLVMIDRLSASASEIFAGAMQDYGRALIVGSQSYGKGTVQSIQSLSHGQLKLTLAKFYRISGKSTQNQGIIPDIGFPSPYNVQDIGENTLPDALPWDTIPPVTYRRYANFAPYLGTLQQQHEQRTADNPDFVYLQEIKAYLARYEHQDTVSLHEKERRLESRTRRSQRLAIENRLRKAHGDTLLNNLDALEDADQNAKKKEDNNKPDAFLQEASRILVDAIRLSAKPANSDNVFRNQR